MAETHQLPKSEARPFPVAIAMTCGPFFLCDDRAALVASCASASPFLTVKEGLRLARRSHVSISKAGPLSRALEEEKLRPDTGG